METIEERKNEKDKGRKRKFKELSTFEKIIKVIRILLAILLFAYGIYGGVMLSFIALTGVASATKSAAWGYVVQILIMLVFIGATSFVGLWIAGVKPFKKRLIGSSVTFLGVYAIVISLLCSLFYAPVTNNSSFSVTPDGYWNLQTGSRIAYEKYEENPTKQYPVIYLHGGAGAPVNGEEHFAKSLAKDGYVVYQYDQFGAGNSSRALNPLEYTVTRHVEDLEAIRETIGATKMILISHSWGGTLAANYMANYPEKVAASIFISPGPIGTGEGLTKYTDAGQKDVNNSLSQNLRYFLSQVLTQMGPASGLYYPMPEENLDKLFMNFHDTLNMKPGSGEYYNTTAAGFGFWANIMTGRSAKKEEFNYDGLRSCDAQCLVVKGEYDYLSTEVTEQYCQYLKNSSMVKISGMGHSVESQYEKEIYRSISSFLKDN